jgi:ribosome-binding ATPase
MAALLLYLIGARSAGKTAVFDALIQTPEGPHFATKGGHRLGTVKVPDARLAILRDLFQPKKYIPAEITFVDVALPANAEGSGFGPLNAFLGEADAFALVVQSFGDTDGAGKPLDPPGQLDSVLLDLAMADLEKIERRIEKIDQEIKRGLKQGLPELAVLQKCKAAIDEGRALRDLELSADEQKQVSSFCFLSQKRLLVVANTGDDDPAGEKCGPLRAACADKGLDLLAFCAPLEAEIAALPPGDQAGFLNDYGLAEPARARLIPAAYHTLDLISFFTVGPDEVRAWTIRRGDNAVAAAGKIHTDLARGFIRAETVDSGTLIEKKTLAACREAGKLRLEGKGYVVQDGDVIEIRANA